MRVVVADDSLLFRDGPVRVLQAHGLDVVGHTDDAEGLVRRVGELRHPRSGASELDDLATDL